MNEQWKKYLINQINNIVAKSHAERTVTGYHEEEIKSAQANLGSEVCWGEIIRTKVSN